MNLPETKRTEATAAALVAGLAAAFVAGVGAYRISGPALLGDADMAWLPYRLALAVVLTTAVAACGAVAAALTISGARRRIFGGTPAALPFRAGPQVLLACSAVAAGVALRFVELARVPEWLWIDDLSLIGPSLALRGRLSDFAEILRPVPFGVAKVYGTTGVLYLEISRVVFHLAGTTVFGVRFLSAFAGCASLVTAALLGRSLLPRGGGALTALALAGLRWHLILSRWAWNMIVLAPVADVATLLLLFARRRRSTAACLVSGAVAGIGAHFYLSAWVVGAALFGLALWPGEPALERRIRIRLGAAFLAGWAVVAAPLMLFHESGTTSYFARAGDHNVLREFRYTKSIVPLFSATANGLTGPWLTPDPSPRQEIPGRSRLGWIFGIPVLVALMSALISPRGERSGLFLLHALAALAATMAGGQADTPNGARFGYLTTITAAAAATGVLLLLNLVPASRRRIAAIAAVGLFAASGVIGARDATLRWPERASTFEGFHGQDTLIGRAAVRWDRYGTVAIAAGLGHSPITYEAIRRYRLDPDLSSLPAPRVREGRTFRMAAAGSPAAADERIVETISDPWGNAWAAVIGKKTPSR
ncbi:MAG TPA: hypothetical protein VJA66_06215 [Thermoanaerobaculia bacterium]